MQLHCSVVSHLSYTKKNSFYGLLIKWIPRSTPEELKQQDPFGNRWNCPVLFPQTTQAIRSPRAQTFDVWQGPNSDSFLGWIPTNCHCSNYLHSSVCGCMAGQITQHLKLICLSHNHTPCQPVMMIVAICHLWDSAPETCTLYQWLRSRVEPPHWPLLAHHTLHCKLDRP